MTETQVKPQPCTTATVPLRCEHLHQPALCDPLFPGRAYPLPTVVPGQEAFVYDADAWDVWNGRRGVVTRYSFFTELHTIHVDAIWHIGTGNYERQKVEDLHMREFSAYYRYRYPQSAGVDSLTPAHLTTPLYKTHIMPEQFSSFVPVGRSVLTHTLFPQR